MPTPSFSIENCDLVDRISIEGIGLLTTLEVKNCGLVTVSGIDGFTGATGLAEVTLTGIGETGPIDMSLFLNLTKIDTTGTLATPIIFAESVLANPALVVTVAPGTAITIPPLPPTSTTFTLTNSYLTTYDFSTLPNVVSIMITDSDFSSLNISTNSALVLLNAYGNKISSLTLPTTPNAVLANVNIGNNLLTGALNLSGFTGLQNLNCDLNTISSLSLPTSLQFLSCSTNPTLGGGIVDFTGLTNLQDIIATTCNLTNITVTANTALTALDVNGNLLSSLNITGNTNLTFLACNDNFNIATLNLTSNSVLGSLRCTGCSLTGLNIAGKLSLTYLQCDGNDINQVAADIIVADLVANNTLGGTLIIQGQRAPIGNLTITGGNWTILSNSRGWTIS